MSIDFSAIGRDAMAHFGALVLYERPGEPPFTLPGVFDRVALDVPLPGADIGVSTMRTQIGMSLSDFPPGFEPGQDDVVQVAMRGGQQVDIASGDSTQRQDSYIVMDVQPDSAGGVVLPLTARLPDDLA